MRTALVCAAWSGVGLLVEAGVAYLLLMYGGEYISRALVDVGQ
ncbi:hypothetical protein [Mycolicibacterium sp. F2034L]|nr:hypothetical protein [Mycolicibacterium sp. F2034L]